MKENTDRMDQVIKDKFEGHEVQVPSDLWASIESNIPSEGGNAGGSSFLKNPFLFSILVISTIAIATYLYTTKDTHNNQTTVASETSSSSVINNPIAHSTDNTTNGTETSSNKETDHSTNTSSLNTTENTSAPVLLQTNSSTDSHIDQNNSTTAAIYSKNKNTQATDKNFHANDPTESNVHSNASRAGAVSHTSGATYLTKKQTIVSGSTNTNAKSTERNASSPKSSNVQSTQTADSDLSLTDKHANSISDNSAVVSSSDQLNNSSSNTANSAATSSYDNTKSTSELLKTQSLNTTISQSNLRTSVYADSIKQFTSTLIQDDNLLNTKNSLSNTSITNAASAKSTESGNNNTSDKAPNLNASQIRNAIVSLNAINSISTASDASSLLSNTNLATQANTASTIEQSLVSSKVKNSASAKESVDSANNTTGLTNASNTNSDLNDANAFAQSKNTVTNTTIAKMDSTILAKEIDSLTAENLAKTTNATTTEESKKKSLFLSRCSFDGYATPVLGYMHLSPNTSETSLNNAIKERNKNAGTGFGITTGLRMNYALTQKIEVGIGLQYSSLSQPSTITQNHIDSSYMSYQGNYVRDSTYDSTSHKYIFTTHYVKTDSTVINNISTQVVKHTDKFQNISIPIHVAYGYSISDKFSLLARTSLLINYQTSSVTYLNALDSSIVGHHSDKHISLGGSFSVGGYYKFSRSCSVFAEPIVYYYFSNVFDKQVPFKQTQFMLGLQTGIRFSF
ncbi:hypothetical protein [Cytophaga aurantiaca]|uniref:hypothetical protein n=1 Tax=Cytophaga aurantiaca TaxID=29530 RepID=UPI00037B1026|nr:hypothetical protein [Cytophaga aurantiaca]